MLKREAFLPSSRVSWYLCLTAILAFISYASGLRDGLTIGSRAQAPVFQCGITAPLDCVLSIFTPTAPQAHETVETVVEAPPRVVPVARRATTSHQRTCGYFMKMYYGNEVPTGTYAHAALLKEVDRCRAHYRATGID